MSEWIDLSRTIEEGAPVYPGDPLFQARPFAEHATDGFRGTRLTIGTHLGTHLDAPFHYFVDGETLDAFPVDFFFGRAACLDLRDAVARAKANARPGRAPALSVDDLEPFEPIFDAVDFVLLRTGWSARYGRPEFYASFPSLSPSVCDWLADYPNLRVLGLETPSLVSIPVATTGDDSDAVKRPFDPEFADMLVPIDVDAPAPSEPTPEAAIEPFDELELCADAECHRILLGRRPPILILEGLVALDAVPNVARDAVDSASIFELACFPAPIKGLDGCPVRAVARVSL